MDSNNWRPTQAGEPPMDTADWRTQLQADSRRRIVNEIMETLKRHLPFSGQEGLQELKKIAVKFEEKICTAATSQSDYLRKISLKMLAMENKSNPMPNAIQSNSAVNSENSPDPGEVMYSINWRPTQGGELGMDSADWRNQLQADSRQRIVNKIWETLKRHFPHSGQEGLDELMKIAVRFEENVYTAATSQSDYLRKISLKMLTMENMSNPMPNAMQSNATGNSTNSPDI